jgi:general secretion pathway protein E/type IV pilus assembly protein PilB
MLAVRQHTMRLEELMNFGDRVDLATVSFTPELLRCLPRHVACKYRALPVSQAADSLRLAIAAPPDLDAVDSLTHILKRPLEFCAADEQQLGLFLERLYGPNAGGSR